MITLNPKVDAFVENAGKWQEEFRQLRRIIIESRVAEEFKWGVPCYTFQNRNILLMHGFKDYCALLFVKGALLSDPRGILTQQTENTQAARQIRFTNPQEIIELEPALKAYIEEAIEVDATRASETSNPARTRQISSPSDAIAHFQQDAPTCPNCGHIAVRNGACYKCLNCGESLGCS